ncbi:hypothetical protein BHE74_00002797, partial [Ensete ventricosum]
ETLKPVMRYLLQSVACCKDLEVFMGRTWKREQSQRQSHLIINGIPMVWSSSYFGTEAFTELASDFVQHRVPVLLLSDTQYKPSDSA